jgi:hypothetical protein
MQIGRVVMRNGGGRRRRAAQNVDLFEKPDRFHAQAPLSRQ